MVLPNGIVGWFQQDGLDKILNLFSIQRRYANTYPSLEEDPEVEYERQLLEKEEENKQG